MGEGLARQMQQVLSAPFLPWPPCPPFIPCFHSGMNTVALFSLRDTVDVLSVQMHWNLRVIYGSFGLNLIPSSVQRYPGATTVCWRLGS